MSADGQGDSVSLNKEEQSSANDAANKISPQDGSSSLPKVDREEISSSVNIISASNVELQATADEETDQMLKPAEKVKALDIDSELDFELKWDDELNPDDQSKIHTDPVSNNEPEEASNDVVMGEETIQIKPSITEKLVDDTTNYEQVPDGKDHGKKELLNTAGELFNDDTNSKIDLNSKLVESDPNSLDEHLVYSDIEAPEVEEKDLLNKLNAHISDDTLINVKLEEGVDTPEAPETGENTEQSALQNDLVCSAMDVDDDTILFPVKKEEIPDVDNTFSSNTEVETSTYEVNNDHGLANPDVMIEIPTQNLIEDFDESEVSEDGGQFDEDILLNNDPTAIQKVVSVINKDASPSRDKDGISIEIPVSEETSSEKTEEKTQGIPGEQSQADIILEATHSATITTPNDNVLPTAETKATTNDDVHLVVEPKSIAKDDVKPTVEPKPTTNNNVLPTAEQNPTTDTDAHTHTAEPKPTTNDDVQPVVEPKPPTSNDVQSTEEPKLDDNVEPTGVTVVEESSLETVEVKKEVEDCPAELAPNTKETEVVSPSADLSVRSPILELAKDSEELEISKDLGKTQVIEAKEGSSSGNLETNEVPDIENVCSPELLERKKVTDAEILSAAVLEAKKDLEKSDSDEEEQVSTSKYLLREYSDVTEVTDSLGLLAESSTVMDDDDEQEQEDDDDDFDQDDESNQMIAEHSEDSNTLQSETDASPSMDVEDSPSTDKEEFTFPKVVEVPTTVADAQDDGMVEERVDVVTDETELAVEALLRSETPKDEETTKDVSEEDVSGVDKQAPESEGDSKLRRLLLQDKEPETVTAATISPSKMKNLEITKTNHELSFVDLEESSSEDDIQEVEKQADPELDKEGMTSVNIPDEVEVMAASAGSMSAMRHGDGEVVISGVPKPPPHKPARLNTSEVSIKTTQVATEAKSLPDAGAPSQDSPAALKYGLEVFSLDSDDDEKSDTPPKIMTAIELDRVRQNKLCVNMYCTSDSTTPLLPCDVRCATYYGVKRGKVCEICMLAVAERTQGLIEGVKAFTPLLSMDMGQKREEFVEISDSDSEEEPDLTKDSGGALGEAGAILLDEKLADMFNVTWDKFNMEDRLRDAENELSELVNKMEGECKEIDAMLTKGQQMTDKVRQELYNTFAHRRQELPAILIYDTLPHSWSGLEDGVLAYELPNESRQSKRRIAPATEPPAKKAAIPLGYTPLDSDADTTQNQTKPSTAEVPVHNEDDSADISVVRLSAEAAPAGLPPPGAPARPPLRVGLAVYAMRNAYGTWHKAKIVELYGKNNANFTTFRVKFEHKVKNPCKTLPGRCLAYDKPSDVRMTIGTRVIALFKDPNNSKSESYYSGIIAEIPNPVNNYRYLVFFDDGYAQYVTHNATRLVCEFAKLVWDEVHPFSRQFVRDYLRAYPERPMVRVHAGQSMKTEWNGKWWTSRVVKVDASLVQVHFEQDDRYEWIYRGSTRLAPLYMELQAAERQRARPLPRAQPGRRSNMPYVEYTRTEDPPEVPASTPQQIEQDIRRQRAVAKKSTALPPARAPAPAVDSMSSRVVHYTPKNSVRPKKMVTHDCGPQCRRIGNPSLKDLRTYNPLAKPLLSGWDRLASKFRLSKAVVYVAPCGRRLRNNRELHRYLRLIDSDLAVDLFDFSPATNCLAEFVINSCFNSKKDLSNGKERVPVPCVNYYDDSLPEFCLYSTQREPTTGVPLNLDPEFLCGCDCTDDCADKTKCACWQLTLEGARTIGFDSDDVGYQYKRLPEPLPSGIYECNSRCKCKQTCLNRVAQHPLQLKLQVFKTRNRGWGIRALNEVPRGAFICVYAGNLLTDATANLDGLIEGDEYLAELDYIEVVEQMKEGFEEDARAPAASPGKKDDGETEFTESSSSGEEAEPRDRDNDDDDFRPAEDVVPATVPEYSNRLRKRDKKDAEEKEKKENSDENCITISDDEELREPARFAAQTGMGAAGFISKYKSVRAHFGEDEACYIMDAKVQGNIGRYLNHSCTPNVFVQNVFVDTHDPRFPWVAFFALAPVAAGSELTWNYNYDVGSVPGKVLYCHCGEPNCRGRLL